MLSGEIVFISIHDVMNELLNFDKIVRELSGAGQGPISHSNGKKYLRHTHPVLSLDRVADHDFGVGWVHAVRAISCSDPVFEGHFPDAGVYPGTSLNQDINQVGILLFIGMTGPLEKNGNAQQITAVKSITSNYGHPVPPGSLLDIAVWASSLTANKAIELKFEARVRDFPFYDQPNKFGVTFGPAIHGTAVLIRVQRRIYDGIWM